jgi:hypothetical protein
MMFEKWHKLLFQVRETYQGLLMAAAQEILEYHPIR